MKKIDAITPATIACALCGQPYPARAASNGDYSLCPECFSRDVLREWDRLESARRAALNSNDQGSPNDLTLIEWLAIITRSRGLCAVCQEVGYSALALLNTQDGLVGGNCIPVCRACNHHLEHGWASAIARITRGI